MSNDDALGPLLPNLRAQDARCAEEAKRTHAEWAAAMAEAGELGANEKAKKEPKLPKPKVGLSSTSWTCCLRTYVS